jgi:hypothetical protein
VVRAALLAVKAEQRDTKPDASVGEVGPANPTLGTAYVHTLHQSIEVAGGDKKRRRIVRLLLLYHLHMRPSFGDTARREMETADGGGKKRS